MNNKLLSDNVYFSKPFPSFRAYTYPPLLQRPRHLPKVHCVTQGKKEIVHRLTNSASAGPLGPRCRVPCCTCGTAVTVTGRQQMQPQAQVLLGGSAAAGHGDSARSMTQHTRDRHWHAPPGPAARPAGVRHRVQRPPQFPPAAAGRSGAGRGPAAQAHWQSSGSETSQDCQ
jgi:hypothetical protein